MLEIINSCLWASLTILIIISGLYFSVILSFPQGNIKKIIKSLTNKQKEKISPLKTLYLTLAGRIGVGSIAGVALAIYIGGPGTIFWMWILALITASLTYTETLNSIKYKENNYGGPSYYIKKGLKNKKLATLYSSIVIIAYIIGFIPIQSNTIIKSINNPNIIVGLFLSLVTYITIKGGINKIIKVTNILVPLMTIMYIILSFTAILANINIFIKIILKIIKSALSITPFLSSFIPTLLIGIQRCIFSNESGTGLGGIAAASSNTKNGCQSGYIQVLGIYITTLLICTSTAFIILTSPYKEIIINNPNGIEITIFAFSYHFKNAGKIFLNILVVLFSFTTVLTGYYYCESSINFITKKSSNKLLKTIIPLSVFFGTIFSPNNIWKLVDIMVSTLVFINIYTLLKLHKETLKYHQKYDRI